MTLTQLLKLSLVTLAAGNSLLLRLGVGDLGLKSGDPAVTLNGVGGLESVLGTVNLEEELGGTLLGQVSGIGLFLLISFNETIFMWSAYQAEDTSGGGLVLSALGEEQQTLTGLASPGGDGVSNSGLLVLLEDSELFSLNSVILEVEEALGETETPVLC